MGLAPVKIPLVVKKMFPNYIWSIPTNKKTLYLTFDDGPTPEITQWTLNTLKTFNAKATFFCIGSNIEKHPNIFQNILNEGHSIGNHTHNHLKGWNTKTKTYLENVELCQAVLKSQITNYKLQITNSSIYNLFRPPYGKMKPKQGKALLNLKFKIVMWDVLSFDWDKTVTKEDCLNNIISKATDGSIIVFHDSVKAAKNMQYALPKVLEHFSESGYEFKALD
ncbi:polysaccharide deacetylase family protein [Aestuariivivens sp. NBU2969]|uniref:polysaccharide deacetylase family protein n=1 Tax=Aestuariivivens sp. NBU2969 TaxID=2873267 RepID=UPI001CBDF830|nr:polysaccharide deacetylase family protein [Aestuariivivens sp. NBU2969]